MPRVLGIDPGTLSIDLCLIDDGRIAATRSFPTSQLGTRPATLREHADELGPLDLIAAPSGYGLPLVGGADLDERRLRLAFLSRRGAVEGLLGLRRAVQELAADGRPIVCLPGVVHLPTVPPHRKVNRIDMGTADKVCAAAHAIAARARATGARPADTSLILVEMGGAFTAVLAIDRGAIVDGVGGTSGPLGFRAAGALDGEAAALAGRIGKDALFTGGAAWVAGDPQLDPAEWEGAVDPRGDAVTRPLWIARAAYVEGIVKAVAALRAVAPAAADVVLSGRLARLPRLRSDVAHAISSGSPGSRIVESQDAAPDPPERLGAVGSAERQPATRMLVKEAAVGAALIADGLRGGSHSELVAGLRIAESAGSIFDHLFLPAAREGAARFLESEA
ncbi:MAG: DUF1464 family protein [Gemmatimonadetes bacterium]|nr:DUF1464 family protein [Gemmatimonadota bacterium]